MTSSLINQAFEPLLGQSAWGAQRRRRLLRVEFGKPIHVVGPVVERPDRLSLLPMDTPRRSSEVHGDWHLQLTCARWSVGWRDVETATSLSDETTLNRALDLVNGQELMGLSLAESDGATRFDFDLGGYLQAVPENPHEVLWTLLQPPDRKLSVRGDRWYFTGTATTPRGTETWAALPA